MDLKFSLSLPEMSLNTPVDSETTYDCAIIGAGPAGLTAAVYALRKGMNIAVIAGNIGGQVVDTKNIQNYMGYTFIEGTDLAKRFFEQVKQFPAAIALNEYASGIEIKDSVFITSASSVKVKSRSIIIAAGKSYRKLGVPGEKEFTGRGIAYCATCDAPLFADKNVAVIGGGNSSAETALELEKIASSVTIFANRSSMTADKILVEKITSSAKIKIIPQSAVKSFEGNEILKSLTYEKDGETHAFKCDGAFIEIGLSANTAFLKNILRLNESGEIIIDASCRTSVPGIFACGDITNVPEKQIIVAAGEGAKATLSAFRYLTNI